MARSWVCRDDWGFDLGGYDVDLATHEPENDFMMKEVTWRSIFWRLFG